MKLIVCGTWWGVQGTSSAWDPHSSCNWHALEIVHWNLETSFPYSIPVGCPLRGYLTLDAPIRSQGITFTDFFQLWRLPIANWLLTTFHHQILAVSIVRKRLNHFGPMGMLGMRYAGDVFFRFNCLWFHPMVAAAPAYIYSYFFRDVCIGNCAFESLEWFLIQLSIMRIFYSGWARKESEHHIPWLIVLVFKTTHL